MQGFFRSLQKQRVSKKQKFLSTFIPSNAELNPICHLLALLAAHHIFHVSRIRVKQETKLNPQCHVKRGQGKYMKYVSFPWFRLEAALSMLNVSPFLF